MSIKLRSILGPVAHLSVASRAARAARSNMCLDVPAFASSKTLDHRYA